ncbi:MAG: hypothetical protein RIK87_14465 [Fuerstiella sp.]
MSECCRLLLCLPVTACLLLVSAGCAQQASPTATEAPPVRRAEASDQPQVLLPRELRRKLKANENAQFERSGNDIVEARLFQSGVKSIDALKGLPLRALDLGMTEVSDLSVIKGMPLQTLILENAPVDNISVVRGMQLEVLHLQNTTVTDLSPLAGMPLRELNLMGVPVEDLSVVAELPLTTLWIPQTRISDISALQGKAMVSLDVEGTQVSSLEPLSGMSTLKRLNIADTPIQDLTPLQGLKLERITLTPDNIQSGIQVLRDMPSLTQILTSMQGPGQSAADFWQKYDAGVWDKTPEEPPAADSEAAPETAPEAAAADPKTKASPDQQSPPASGEAKPAPEPPKPKSPATESPATESPTAEGDTPMPSDGSAATDAKRTESGSEPAASAQNSQTS